MSRDTKTIDQRLCEQAREKLREEIRMALEPARELARTGSHFPTEEGKPDVMTCLSLVSEALYKYHLPRREEDARREFIEKVNRLSERVEELRAGVQS